jgi:hypothetical protein
VWSECADVRGSFNMRISVRTKHACDKACQAVCDHRSDVT